MSLVLALPMGRPIHAFEAEPTPACRERLARRQVGDPEAMRGYVARANRIALVALGTAIVFGGAAAFVSHAFAIVSAIALAGAWFDWSRGRLVGSLRIEGDAIVVVDGPYAGIAIPRSAIVAIGFGAAARGARSAPETFWRADFGGVARSHLVVVRLDGRDGRPRRLIVPEAGIAEAQAAAVTLSAWR